MVGVISPQHVVPSGAAALNADHAVWVLRDTHAISGYDPQARRLCWRLVMPPTSYMCPAQLDTYGELVLTTVRRPAGSDMRGLIVAVRPRDGAVAWSLDVSQEAAGENSNARPLTRLTDQLLLNVDPEGPARIIQADDGAVSTVLKPLYEAWSVGDGLAIARDAWDRDPLSLVRADGEVSPLPLQAGRRVLCARRHDDRVCVIWNDRESGQVSLSALELETGALSQTIPLEASYGNSLHIEPAGPGRVWVWSGVHSDPLWLVDLQAARIVWSAAGYVHDPALSAEAAIVAVPDDMMEPTRLVRLGPAPETLATAPFASHGALRASPAGLWLTLAYLPEELPNPIDEYGHEFSVVLEDAPPPATLKIGPLPASIALLDVVEVAATALERAQEELRAALRQGRGGDWPGAFRELRRVMGVRALKAGVKARLKALPLDTSAFTYGQLFGAGPRDQLVPALLVETDAAGRYTLLHLKTGALARTHHDNYDEFGGLERALLESDPAAFLAAFFKQYAIST